jgi:peptidoglycan/LPS O-acetylase OafA/YrhL
MQDDAAAPRRLGRRPALDGLRGVAIVLVMSMHLGLLPNGFIGVDLFFALSGFLITTLLYEEWDRAATISLRRFYGRRARRLLPGLLLLFLLVVAVDVACYRMTGWALGYKVLASTLFVSNWVAATGHIHALGALNPTWSLAQEEQFYMVWPLVLLLMLRRRLSPQVVAALLVGAIVALLALAPHARGIELYYSPLTRVPELLLGCLGAVVWRHRLVSAPAGLRRRLPALLRRDATRKLACSIAACVLVYLFVIVLLDCALQTEQAYLLACLISVVLIPTLLSAPQGLVARLLSLAPLRHLGRISYSLYLFHLLTRNVVYHYRPAGSTVTNAAITIAVSVTLSAASWYLMESRVLGRPRVAPSRRGSARLWFPQVKRA